MTSDFLCEWRNSESVLQVHTSGSTGKPKTLFVEKRRMRASALMTLQALGLKSGDTALLCLSTDYIAGKMMAVRADVGGLQLIETHVNSHPLQGLPDTPCIDLCAMVPLQVHDTLQVPAERERLKAIKHLLIGGGAIDEAHETELRTFPNAVWSTYGMTETLSHIALRRISGPHASQWYTPLTGVAVGSDNDGCLWIEAPAVNPLHLQTNDIVRFASDGCRFQVLGRRDNTVCSGGIKLQIETLEAQLAAVLPHPFALTKVSDRRLGEALVMLTQDEDTEAVKAVCDSTLPPYSRPKHYCHVPALPLTATKKIARGELQHIAQHLITIQL